MEKHLGAVVIIVKKRQEAASGVNELLSQFGNIIVSRTGFPYEKRGVNVITLIVDGTTDEIGALTGKLGMFKSVTVKTTLAKV
ncbi:MAG: iron-only hydrogenase system regulator [Candidatus Omnitrophica bacterium]|nr:iron-only hydrogenase system regulator [Candidatus Omnitrophota bacterium]MDD5079550.1 iron-only hydrogenase system regulator [Candidatus Omnitrophota bacterium]